MASSNLVSSPVLLALAAFCLLFLQPHPSNANSLTTCHFDKIYQLGDSVSDTGNLIREKPIGAATAFARLPYGETFFKHATGRTSNGRLMIDFIASASGLPFLNPYLKKDANFRNGVNFAVAGSTALPVDFLAKENIIVQLITNSSLHVQLDWMSKHFTKGVKSITDCLEKPNNTLFIVGVFGGNDYNYASASGKTLQEINAMVPEVVNSVVIGVKRVISVGGTRVVVPGIFPFGCFPLYLTAFQTNDSTAYDKDKCLKELNSFSKYHNGKLQEAIQELKREYPHVVIVYGDYYHAFEWLYNHAVHLGFDGASTQKACCGIGGDYNFNFTMVCSAETPVCSNPNQFISWDGAHLTEAANKRMAGWLIDDMLPKLHCYN
ncbi:hypothetical protein RHSIM_Rhsim07G0189800 [Rhododendron simsii]|uniref:Uncharacterized protein n=1 Tax=Rhododendron simsii TaxID=118357 RepID=A0A834LJH0_RHOSS|nr:hypothetical protein RHSIM_Rhsim07G0189800 [Rhododendron simsii]